MKGVILGVRQIRGEMDISPARRLPLLLQRCQRRAIASASQRHAALLARLAGIDSVAGAGRRRDARRQRLGAWSANMTLLVPMAGPDRPGGGTRRASTSASRKRTSRKSPARAPSSAMPNFVNHAPPEVVVTQSANASRSSKNVNESLARQLEIVQGLVSSPPRRSQPHEPRCTAALARPRYASSSARPQQIRLAWPACWRAATC